MRVFVVQVLLLAFLVGCSSRSAEEQFSETDSDPLCSNECFGEVLILLAGERLEVAYDEGSEFLIRVYSALRVDDVNHDVAEEWIKNLTTITGQHLSDRHPNQEWSNVIGAIRYADDWAHDADSSVVSRSDLPMEVTSSRTVICPKCNAPGVPLEIQSDEDEWYKCVRCTERFSSSQGNTIFQESMSSVILSLAILVELKGMIKNNETRRH